MLDTETIKNISTFVEITMQVESRLRSKYELKEEQLAEDLEGMKKAYGDLDRQAFELEEKVKDLEGQRDRQAAKIIGLTDERDRQKKQIAELGKELKARVDVQPAADEELQQKLDKAMDHIRRQGEEIDKLRAGAADPRWIPMSEKRPCGGATVIVCTKRGVVDVATETVDGWKRSTGKMAEPVAWMPLPVRYEEA